MLSAPILFLFLSSQQPPACATLEVCRAEALIAHARKDFEAFHDLAWAAYRKGRSNDPELMLLVARAQSLSGRPGDAMVMIERVAALGSLPPEVLTGDDFARVRALPRWEDVRQKLAAGATASSQPAAEAPAVKPGDPPSRLGRSGEAGRAAERPNDRTTERSTSATASTSTKAPASAKAPADKPVDKPDRSSDPAAPLKFATVLSPSALAYDGVSRRYLVADRRGRRIEAIDESTGQVATLVGPLGALGDIGGIAIDPQQGDLWVVSSDGEGPKLHRMQLISGRLRSTVSLTGLQGAIVAVAYVGTSGLVAADDAGLLWRIRTSGKAEKLTALEYVPRALASDAAGLLYVSAGGPRLARFAMSPSFHRLDVVELEPGIVRDGPFALSRGRLLAVVKTEEGYEIRSSPLKR